MVVTEQMHIGDLYVVLQKYCFSAFWLRSSVILYKLFYMCLSISFEEMIVKNSK